jgi:hypothetical protein
MFRKTLSPKVQSSKAISSMAEAVAPKTIAGIRFEGQTDRALDRARRDRFRRTFERPHPNITEMTADLMSWGRSRPTLTPYERQSAR